MPNFATEKVWSKIDDHFEKQIMEKIRYAVHAIINDNVFESTDSLK